MYNEIYPGAIYTTRSGLRSAQVTDVRDGRVRYRLVNRTDLYTATLGEAAFRRVFCRVRGEALQPRDDSATDDSIVVRRAIVL